MKGFTMSSSRRLRALTVGIAVVGASALTPSAVGAAVAPTSGPACVTMISPVAPGAKVSETHDLGCWNSLAEANAANGVVGAGEASLFGQMSLLAPALTAATVTIGIDYSDTGFSGFTQEWLTPHLSGCSDGSVYLSVMPGNFNNATRSVAGFTGCYHNRHYDPPSASGLSIACSGNCATMGSMDQKTSYVRWAP